MKFRFCFYVFLCFHVLILFPNSLPTGRQANFKFYSHVLRFPRSDLFGEFVFKEVRPL